jgi:adenylate kinase
VARLVFLGPPGAGKGTQAERLKADLGLLHLATGDLLREEVAAGTPLGEEAKRHMDAGDLVPDDVVTGMIRGRLEGGAERFLLDGFPRTVPQAEALDEMLAELGAPLDAVLLLTVPRDELVRRLAGRWLCRVCGRSWHEVFNPHRRDDRCPPDRECELYQREDDRPETVARRLDVYDAQTAPLIGYYTERGLLREIDGERSPDEVHAQIEASLPTAPQ